LVSKLFRRPKNSKDREFPLLQVVEFASAELLFQESEEIDVQLSSVIPIIVPSVRDDKKILRGSRGAEKMDQIVDLLTLSRYRRLL